MQPDQANLMPRAKRQTTLFAEETSAMRDEKETTETTDELVMPSLDGASTRSSSDSEDKGVVTRSARKQRNKRITLLIADGKVNWEDSKDAREKLSEVAKTDPSLASVVGTSNPADLPDDVVIGITNAAMMPIGAAAAIVGPKLSPDIAKCPIPLGSAIQLFSVQKSDFSESQMDAAKRVLVKRGPAWFLKWQDEMMWASVLTTSIPKKFDAMVAASKRAYLEAQQEIEARKRPNGSSTVPLQRPL